MTTIVGMLRKTFPNVTFKRAYGRGQVWWYMLSKASGKHLIGHRSSAAAINKLKKKFEGWESSWVSNGDTFSYYHFIIRDDKGHVLGAALIHQYLLGEGGCVLIDEILVSEESLPAFHAYNRNKPSPSTYKRIS